MDRSDAYLVPRRRAGLVRKFLNPLVSEGRPYHGAWYYIKLRKIGNKLEYYFDNERIFEATDPEMIREGLLGIWTFMHSMTVAQVKITFDKMRFPDLPLSPVPAPPDPRRRSEPADVAMDGVPLHTLDTRLWSVDDSVGHAVLRTVPGHAPGLAVVNRMGSGSMFAKCGLPPQELRGLAGWQFLLKRTPDAQLNAYYSIGTMNDKGEYTPEVRCVHRISGDAFADGPLVETGSTPVDGSQAAALEEGWAPVQVWIPEHLRPTGDDGGARKVRFEGFGTMGESLGALRTHRQRSGGDLLPAPVLPRRIWGSRDLRRREPGSLHPARRAPRPRDRPVPAMRRRSTSGLPNAAVRG